MRGKDNTYKEDISHYLQEIGKHKLLSAEEQRTLAKKAKAGDANAQKRLIESNLRLVVSIAKKYINKSALSLKDFIQEGNIAIISALKNYKVSKDTKFSTFAKVWIEKQMLQYISKERFVIHIPDSVRRCIRQFTKTKDTLTKQNEQIPTIDEIADKMKIDRKAAVVLDELSCSKGYVPFQDLPKKTWLYDKHEIVFENGIDDNSILIKKTILSMLGRLTKKERKAFYLRFWRPIDEVISLKKLAQVLGMTIEGAKKVEKRMIDKLKKIAKEKSHLKWDKDNL
jgi:RNA polymerase sigma factor (sigma-70 family)